MRKYGPENTPKLDTFHVVTTYYQLDTIYSKENHTPWSRNVNWMNIRRSEDVQDSFCRLTDAQFTSFVTGVLSYFQVSVLNMKVEIAIFTQNC